MQRVRRSRLLATHIAAATFAFLIAFISGASFLPIYDHPRIWLVTGVGAFSAWAVIGLSARLRWGIYTVFALLAAYAVIVLPVAVPSALEGGIGGLARAEFEAIAEIAFGWKHILTLTLPLGTYQKVMVPALVTTMVTTAIGAGLIYRGGQLLTVAPVPALLPILTATYLGSSEVSGPIERGPIGVNAPQETFLWLGTIGVVALWVAVISTAPRRRALRRGRQTDEKARSQRRRGIIVRSVLGVSTLTIAGVGGVMVGSLVDDEQRQVPRDQIEPDRVVREQITPLAGYRSWKNDALYDSHLFTITGEELPSSVRIAVLDHYDGVDFRIGEVDEVGRFVRFPSAPEMPDSAEVHVEIGPGYESVWVPTAELASPPQFFGPRALELADSFFVNSSLDTAVAVPTEDGLQHGDGFTARMRGGSEPLTAPPLEPSPLIDLDRYPELSHWLETQEFSSGARGLLDAVETLRERGYLSHSLLEEEGNPSKWLAALTEAGAYRFMPSQGGHGAGRVEELFEDLNEQQRNAPSKPTQPDLVAAIGDDEQFATATALLARAFGYDSRIVLGVRLGEEEAQDPIPTCAGECQGRHVSAWVEVQGDDGVWAALDASPQIDILPTLVQQGEQYPEHVTVPEQHEVEQVEPPVGDTEQESGETEDEEEPEDSDQLLRRVLLVVGAFLLVLILVLFFPAAKVLRRRLRRRRRPAELRAMGAWQEIVDHKVDRGQSYARNSTRSDIAEDIGVSESDQMTALIDKAVFSREGITDAQAQEYWQWVDDYLAQQREHDGVGRRIRAAYSLRSFGRRSRKGKRDKR